MTYEGYGLTLTGVGAPIGVPMAKIGGAISFAGSAGEFYFSHNLISSQGAHTIDFYAIDKGALMLMRKIPGMTILSQQILEQNVSIKFMLIEKEINSYT